MSANLTFRGRRWWRFPRYRDDRGSMPMVMLVILVGVSLSAVLLPMLLTQQSSSRFEISRVRALNAAQNGIDTAVGLMRAATSTAQQGVTPGAPGDPRSLPCTPFSGTTNSGSANGTGNGSYKVSITYYAADNPASHYGDAAWLTNNKMKCVQGEGTYDPGDGIRLATTVPSFALITSSGTDGVNVNSGPNNGGTSQGRTLQSTFVFATTNAWIHGDTIQVANVKPGAEGTWGLCLSGSTDPSVVVNGGDRTVYMVYCPDPALTGLAIPPAQSWFWGSDGRIVLTRSIGDTSLNPNGAGLCLTHTGWSSFAQTTPCPPDGTQVDQATMMWGFFHGRLRVGPTQVPNQAGYCLTPMYYNTVFNGVYPYTGLAPYTGPASGSRLASYGCDATNLVIGDIQQMIPRINVGTGFVNSDTWQIAGSDSRVCPYVTGQNALANPTITGPGGGDFLRVGSCDGYATGAPLTYKPHWYQEFRPTNPPQANESPTTGYRAPTTGLYITNVNDDKLAISMYCMLSSGTVGTSVNGNTAGAVKTGYCGPNLGLPWPKTFGGTPQAQWTYYGVVDSQGNILPYAKRNTLQDYLGNCMAVGTILFHGTNYTDAVVTKPCDGTTSQKWNASPNDVPAQLNGLREIPYNPSPTVL